MNIGSIINKAFAFQVAGLVGTALFFVAKKVGRMALSKMEGFFASKVEAFVKGKIEKTALFRYFFPMKRSAPESPVVVSEKVADLFEQKPVDEKAQKQYDALFAEFYFRAKTNPASS
jgi:hypothetical protein